MFRNWDLHFLHLNITCLLLNAKNFHYIAKSTNAPILDISASRLSVLETEISIENYKTLDFDENRLRGGVAYYVKNVLIYNLLSAFPFEIENIFFENLLPNSKPIIVETNCPPGYSNFFEVTNNKIQGSN